MSFQNNIPNYNDKNITLEFSSTAISKDYNRIRICPGKSCNNEGIYPLRILFINKLAYFCEYHKEKFVSLKIVEPITKREVNAA